MSATTEVLESVSPQVRRAGSAPLKIRVRTRLHRHRLDTELVSGADPNEDPLLRDRAQELVGQKCRRRLATSLEHLLAAADSSTRSFSARVPVARAAIRDSRADLETIIERLATPAYVSARGVAMISVLLADGAGPLYGSDPTNPQILHAALRAALDSLDNGPMLVG